MEGCSISEVGVDVDEGVPSLCVGAGLSQQSMVACISGNIAGLILADKAWVCACKVLAPKGKR